MVVNVDLSPLSNLTSLTINHASIYALTVSSIPTLSQLRSLDLRNTDIREYPDHDLVEGFFPDLAANLEHLTSLNLSSCRWVCIFDLPDLSELESLERLDIRGTHLMARDLGFLGPELPVTSCTVSSCSPECLDQLSRWVKAGVANRIETLDLCHGWSLTLAQKLQVVSAIASAGPQLKSLAISNFGDMRSQMVQLAGLTQLTSLRVGLCPLDGAAVCQLTALTGLKDLSIMGEIEAEGQGYMSELAGSLKQLTMLQVCDANAVEAAKEAFKSRMLQCTKHSFLSTHELALRSVQ